ncbi:MULTISPECIES: hypothetical protein [Kitasatospora]|uniref:Ig-like domain-containing protein n=1 Tax=Kitasatospora setae (strain ATCC 33774 / DSM 43861 / JCM 3304 / KCC A-0304 / NBRC 14216 / KM-6054) TaxID=452652 RepID=E4N5F5_KITSK|nr:MULTISPECIES: hypothetical protein [Kitasatospora]BAJ26436.1 hypothetical protein KSE_05940 [Kitasatospora setae KM-6054]
MRKNLLALLPAAALALATAAAPSAYGASTRALTTVSVVCTGSDTTNYNPGLRTFSQTVDTYGTDTGSGCTGVGRITGLTSFSASFSGTYTASCISPIQSGSGTETLTWNDGSTSVWAWHSTVATNSAGQLVGTYDGTITTGRYAGANLNNTDVEPNTNVTACFSSPGLTQTTGTATWTFTEL